MSQHWPRLSRRHFSELFFGAFGGWFLSDKAAAQPYNAAFPDSQPVSQWTAAAVYDIRVFPDSAKEPLAGPGIVYCRSGNVDLRLDVYTAGPESVVRPTIVFIHGGGWVQMHKEERVFYVLSYLARGMNVVNVEYRLANVARAPAAVEDVRSALHWVHGHAQQYGFDANKLVVIGESAGGHLALMAGMLTPRDGFDDDIAWSLRGTPVRAAAIINYFGLTDLPALLQQPAVPPFLLEWLGSGANRMELAKQMSPLTYVQKEGPPTITIHGDKDPTVPYDQAVSLHQALEGAGVRNELVTIPGGSHGQRNFPRAENIRAQQAIFRFLENNGILPSEP
jgi:acetyl esterase/lipase